MFYALKNKNEPKYFREKNWKFVLRNIKSILQLIFLKTIGTETFFYEVI